MKIVIITRGRVGNVKTLASIPPDWLDRTVIMCPVGEVNLHQRNHPGVTIRSEGSQTLNYSQKFDAIVNGDYPELGERIVIMDDDLRFSVRSNNKHGKTSLITATPEEVSYGLYKLEQLMHRYPLAGLHARAMGNNTAPGIMECTRINAVQGLNRTLIGKIKLDHWPILADMVLNLSLLMRGQKTAVSCDLFWDQCGPSNAPGGCSLHRTQEQQTEAVLGLAEMFPEVVSVVEKEVIKGWFGGKRVDFRIQWKKAYQLGLERLK